MKNKGLYFALITMLISGVSVFANGALVKGMDPIVQTTLKNGLVGLMVVGWLVISGKLNQLKTLTKNEWSKLGLIAGIGGSISFGLFFTGLKIIGATDGALIHKSLVVWVMLLAIPLLKEKISPLFSVAAISLYAVNFLGGATLHAMGIGHAMVLAATALWAIESILIKKFLSTIDTDILLFGRMGIGSLLLALYMMVTGKAALIALITPVQWQGIVIVSALLFGYVMTWYRAVKYAPVTAVSSILVGATVITTALVSLSTGKISSLQLIQSAVISGLVGMVGFGLQTAKRVPDSLIVGVKNQNSL